MYEIVSELTLPRPLAEVFPFFSDARNLELLTPAWLRFEVLTPGPIEMKPGTLIDYRQRWARNPSAENRTAYEEKIVALARMCRRLHAQGVTHARVMGGLGWAEYKSTHLNRGIRHFVEVSLDNVEDRSVAYIEAKALVLESNELMIQENFSGHANLKLEPEDKLTITVTAQSITGDFLIDDIGLYWQNNSLWQEIGTRQVYVE